MVVDEIKKGISNMSRRRQTHKVRRARAKHKHKKTNIIIKLAKKILR